MKVSPWKGIPFGLKRKEKRRRKNTEKNTLTNTTASVKLPISVV